MKDKIASDKGRSGSTDQGGGGGSNKPVLVGGAAHSKAASHAVTGGFAFSLYDAGLGANYRLGRRTGSEPASATVEAYSHAHLLSAPFLPVAFLFINGSCWPL